MGTTSSVPAVLDAFLDLVNLSLDGVTAYEQWPGPSAAPEMVVLGEIEWDNEEIATIKAGRKQRQEDWAVEFEVFVFHTPGTVPDDPKPARDRAYAIFAEIEDVCANDPKLGVGIQYAGLRPTSAGPRKFEKGWAYRIACRLYVFARLT